jgi:hypothetical protein
MNLTFIKKNLFVFIVIVLIIVFLISFFLVSQFNGGKPSPTPLPSGEAQTPQEGKSYSALTDQAQEQIRKDELVGKLIDQLPHKGTNFTLTYNISNNRFTATFNTKNRAQGEQELNQYLKQNQIDSTDWLYNYTVKNQ